VQDDEDEEQGDQHDCDLFAIALSVQAADLGSML